MKKFSLIKGFLLILMSVVLIGTTGVYAADSDLDGELSDLTDFSNSSNTSNTTNTSNTSNTTNTTNTSNTNNTTNKTNNTTNSSVYNNTNNTSLPKTGIEDSLPTMVLVVIFAVSAVYAYKKINEYKNI